MNISGSDSMSVNGTKTSPQSIYQETYVRGGKGNARLIGWARGHLDDKKTSFRDNQGNTFYYKYYKNNPKSEEKFKKQEESLKQFESELMRKLFEGLSNETLYDYRPNNKDYPKEWDNVQWGNEIWKVSKMEWIGFWSVVVAAIGVGWHLVSLIF